MKKKWILVLSLVLAMVGTYVWSQDTNLLPPEQTGKVTWPLRTGQDAERVGRSIVGFHLNETRAKAKKIVISKRTIPFIGKKLVGKSAWKISVHDVDLIFLRGEVKIKNPYIHKFEATVLAETGQLLEIRSVVPSGETIVPPLMSAEEAEKRYKMTSEVYESLPDIPPELSFEEVLQRAYESGVADITNARQIIGHYVVNFQKGLRPSQRLWILHLRGMPPYPAKGISTASEIERSHLRLLFDMQGNFILGDNQP